MKFIVSLVAMLFSLNARADIGRSVAHLGEERIDQLNRETYSSVANYLKQYPKKKIKARALCTVIDVKYNDLNEDLPEKVIIAIVAERADLVLRTMGTLYGSYGYVNDPNPTFEREFTTQHTSQKSNTMIYNRFEKMLTLQKRFHFANPFDDLIYKNLVAEWSYSCEVIDYKDPVYAYKLDSSID